MIHCIVLASNGPARCATCVGCVWCSVYPVSLRDCRLVIAAHHIGGEAGPHRVLLPPEYVYAIECLSTEVGAEAAAVDVIPIRRGARAELCLASGHCRACAHAQLEGATAPLLPEAHISVVKHGYARALVWGAVASGKHTGRKTHGVESPARVGVCSRRRAHTGTGLGMCGRT
ncbi:hypothetical protein NDU88_002113 [Pleurodeles waltl]|uniref:Uncharacterized protein n=1 Tax=Pleurodeles waltl TaxID=8319 RepID=A0AAV7TL19_PLEWA|nr:hypothetical protein NDU88_002113 [Pleurodeles waltl]